MKNKITKEELILRIELEAKTLTNFFRWVGYKHPNYKAYSFRNGTKKLDPAIIKLYNIYKNTR